METKITNYDDSRAKGSFKGNFDFKIKFRDYSDETKIEKIFVIEIKNAAYFDTGSKRFVTYPGKKKQSPEGKWEKDFDYFNVPYGKELIEEALVDALKDYLSRLA